VNDHDPLVQRLRTLDPADPAVIDEETRVAGETRRRILATPVDELAARRGRRRRIAAAAAAAAVAAALVVPLALLSPLSDEPQLPPPTAASRPTGPSPDPSPASSDRIVVTDPLPGARVASPVVVAGEANVYEATVSIRILDATNDVIADTFTTATCGTGCWGEFREAVAFSVGSEQPGVIQVFEASADDGSPTQVVRIPVTLVPGPQDPIAADVEESWTGPDGEPVPDGLEGRPLVLHSFEGPDHCGWTSLTMLHLAWPLGTPSERGEFRQYLRDPHGLLTQHMRVPFEPETTLPADAAATGYRVGAWELWIADSDARDAVYLVNGTGPVSLVERWGRAAPPVLCA
jgi:hypothetical protein